MVGVEEGELTAVGSARRLGDLSHVVDERVLVLRLVCLARRGMHVAERGDEVRRRDPCHRLPVERGSLVEPSLGGTHARQRAEREVVVGEDREGACVGGGSGRELPGREVFVAEVNEGPREALGITRAPGPGGARQQLDRPRAIAEDRAQEGGARVGGQPGPQVEHALGCDLGALVVTHASASVP